MRKNLLLAIILPGLFLSACLPAAFKPKATASPNPISVADLQKTATVLAREALQSQTTLVPAPSDTAAPAIIANTPTHEIPTDTLTSIPPTQTATSGAELTNSGTPAPAATSTSTTAAASTPTSGAPIPLHSGTMPPSLPFGNITLINRSKTDVYISLRCVTKDDLVTIIEYPVAGMEKVNAPAGRYTYVVWVGGRQIIGEFALGKSQDLTIKIFKDRVEIK